jgi:hypothetical protein
MIRQTLASAAGGVALLLTGAGFAHATISVGPETPELTAISAPVPGENNANIDVGLSSNNTSASSLAFNGSTVSLTGGSEGSTFFDFQVRDKTSSSDTFSLGSSLNAAPLVIDVNTSDGLFTVDLTISPTADVTAFTTPDTNGTGTGGFDLLFNYQTDPHSTVAFDVFDPNGNLLTFGLPQTVPEPASLALLGMGLAGFGLMRRRRKAA